MFQATAVHSEAESQWHSRNIFLMSHCWFTNNDGHRLRWTNKNGIFNSWKFKTSDRINTSLVVMSDSEVKAQWLMFVSSHDVQSTDSCCRSKKRSVWAHLQEERRQMWGRLVIREDDGKRIYVQQICRQTSWQEGVGHEKFKTGVDRHT